MKYILFTLLLVFISNFIDANASFCNKGCETISYGKKTLDIKTGCEYKDKFEQCLNENFSGGHPRSIEDFICISSLNEEEILSQVVLDVEFKKIDKKAERALYDLLNNKEYYFGEKREYNEIEAINHIENVFGVKNNYDKQSISDFSGIFNTKESFGSKYVELCNFGIIKKKFDTCVDEMSNKEAINFLSKINEKNGNLCEQLVDTKLAVYKKVAYDLLVKNKGKVRSDERKKLRKEQRGKYKEVFNLFNESINFITDLYHKWPSKTEKCWGG